MQKRLMTIVILLLALSNRMAADDQLSISNFGIFTDSTATVSITLTNDNDYAAFQFDLELPEGITIKQKETGGYDYSANTERITTATDLSMQLQSDGTYRFVFLSQTATALSGSSGGAIINLTLQSTADIAAGSKTGYFKNIKLSKADGTGPTYTQQSFTFTVRDNEPYAALSEDNTVLTFYYDKKKDVRNGMIVSSSSWSNNKSSITSVIFDSSFANYNGLTETASWFSDCSNLSAITGLENLNTDSVTSMRYMFNGCSSLTALDLSNFNTAKVTDMGWMLRNCSGLTSLNLDVNKFDTQNVLDMALMFEGCSSLTTIDVSHFNTAKVTNMGQMFRNCSSLTNLDVSHFTTNQVENMHGMFNGCSSLTNLDVSGFNTESVTDITAMFSDCSGLTSLDVSNFRVSNVAELSSMFYKCELLTNLDLSGFNTSTVTNTVYMFYDCSALKTIYVGDGWSTDAVTSSDNMFTYCENLIGGKGTAYNDQYRDVTYGRIDGGPDSETPGYLTHINTPASYNVNVSVVGNGKLTVDNTEIDSENPQEVLVDRGVSLTLSITPDAGYKLDNIKLDDVDVTAQVDTAEVSGALTYTLNGVYGEHSITATFVNDTNEPYAVLSEGNTILTFYYDKQKEESDAIELYSLSTLDSEVKQTITTVVFTPSFADCTTITSTSGWFNPCTNLETITGIEYLKTDNVTDMSQMFMNCRKLTSLDVTGFNTESVKRMGSMFNSCTSLISLDLSNFVVNQVTDMSMMFSGCYGLTTLDLRSFNTLSLQYTDYMFQGSNHLRTIYVDYGWTVSNVLEGHGRDMFDGCMYLAGGAGTAYDSEHTDFTYAHIDYGSENPGYLTAVADKGKNFPYAVLSDDNKTLTFYYNGDRDNYNWMKVGETSDLTDKDWLSYSNSITSVVIDDSFSGYTALSSTAFWFYGLSNLTSITGLNNLNTESKRNMNSMFRDCQSLTSLDLSELNTAEVTDMGSMFSGCTNLSNLTLNGSFDTSSAVYMNEMFKDCTNLTELDLSIFNIAKAENMSLMFSNASNLKTIYVGNGWATTLEPAAQDMFSGCTSLVGGSNTVYDETRVDFTYARIDGGPNSTTPGYFTDIANSGKEVYMVLTDENSKLTFYYDANKETRSGTVVGLIGTGGYGWSSYKENITSVEFDPSFVDYHGLTSTKEWFMSCNNLATITGISNLNTSNVTDMTSMFQYCSALTSLDLSSLNTSNVTKMTHMFYDCQNLESLNISNFNTANVTGMEAMFYNCNKLTSLNLSSFVTDNVTNMQEMFWTCSSLTDIDVTGFKTDIVTSMAQMFFGCSGLTTLDLSSFNTVNATEMTGMFGGCTNLVTIYVGNNWSAAQAETGGNSMFNECTSIIGGRGTVYSSANIDWTYAHIDGGTDNPGYLTDINTQLHFNINVTVIGNGTVVAGGTEVTSGTEQEVAVDRGGSLELTISPADGFKLDSIMVDTTNVTSQIVSLAESNAVTYTLGSVYGEHTITVTFTNDTKEAYAVLSNEGKTVTFYYDKLKESRGGVDINRSNTFNTASFFTGEFSSDNPYDTAEKAVFDTSFAECDTISSTAWWFCGCDSLKVIEGLEYLRTDKVTNMSGMFYFCASLLELNLNSFITNNVTSMSAMFEGCAALDTLDLINFNTAKVTAMDAMFQYCSSMKGINLESFNTANVTGMRSMFYGCGLIKTLDLSSFNTAKVEDMSQMFELCDSLVTIYVGNGWSTESLTETNNGMFNGCFKLVGGSGTPQNSNNAGAEYARIDGGINSETPGYLTDKFKVILTATDFSREYGEENPEFGFTIDAVMGISGTPIITCEATDTTAVGTYPIAIAYEEAGRNITLVNGKLTITKAPLTITAKDYSIYQGEELPTFEADYSGFKNNETDTVFSARPIIGLASTSVNEPGEYEISVSGAVAKNYSMNYVSGTLTVMKKDTITITANSYSRVYGDANPSFEYTVEGGNISGTPVITCEATATSPVGEYPITITISKENTNSSSIVEEVESDGTEDSRSRVEIIVNGTLTITKAPLTVTAKSYTIKRGGTLPTFEYESSGFKNNETDTVFTKKPTITCEAKADTLAGTYQIVPSGAEAKNYEIKYVNGTLTITDDVVVTAKSYSRMYGEANPTFEFTSVGAILDGKPSITCAATATSPVGTYDIVIAKGDVTNSEVTYVNGTLTITKAPLTVTAKSYTIKRGGTLPTFEYESSGFKNNETDTVFTKKPTITCEAKADTLAGTYQIVPSGAEAKNYEIKYVNGTLTITDDVVVTAKSYTRVYGDANPTFEYTSEGAILDGKPSITCTATATSPVGTYDIVIAKGDVTNSEITYVNGTLTITKAPLTITAKSYSVKEGKDLPTLELEYSGFKNGETDTVFTTRPTVTTNATKYSSPGTYDITVSGAEARNYSVTYVNGRLTITAKTESYDASTNVLTVEDGGNIDDAFESIGGRTESAKTIAAIIWNSKTPLTSEMLEGISNPNLLIYVTSEDLAPKGRNNVVVNGTAKNVVLTSGESGNYNFHAPIEFTAENISYTRDFRQTTQKNVSRGWEGIALPFTVQTYTHDEHGAIAPFGNTESSSHFWLRQITENGVADATTIEAYKPYIISMPNSEEYSEQFNQAGVVTFAAEKAKVPVTETQTMWLGDSAMIVTTFVEVEKSEHTYALNVGEAMMNNPEGSIFVSDYRNVRPFEVYTFHEPGRNGSGSVEEEAFSRIISLASIFGGGNATGISDVEPDSNNGTVRVYSLNGTLMKQGKRQEIMKQLPKGIYIVNGRKMVVK